MNELQQLRDRVAELEELLGAKPDVNFRLMLNPEKNVWVKACGPLLGMLMKRDMVTKDAAFTVLYGDRSDADQPASKIIDVIAWRLRKACRARGVVIQTVWGEGFRLDHHNKAKLQALIDEYKAQQ